MAKRNDNWFRRAFGISLMLHLLFIGSAGYLASVGWFATTAPKKSEEPLVFEFEAPKAPEVVETPESARTDRPDRHSSFVSDKNARAQNEEAPEDLPLDEAYSDGLARTLQPEELPTQLPQPATQEPQPEPQTRQKPQIVGQRTEQPFSREMLTRPQTAFAGGELVRPRSENRRSRAPDMGEFSINTYEWDFAPYMLRLKRRIEKHIFPPPAFTYMGIISGEAVIRFRILPDGTLTNLEVLSYAGHKSLLNTSVSAVEVSAPFEPLPADFPEPYLEVTGRFEYINTNR